MVAVFRGTCAASETLYCLVIYCYVILWTSPRKKIVAAIVLRVGSHRALISKSVQQIIENLLNFFDVLRSSD